ncbi:uncharacterized protein MONOS_10381 [Monocercomonoides exilis]|uniref:uncharacterized protein n=1 Tax=Monocercomonoides exilis TaxID=2049356 RepID=UPI00355A734F|nr:hypothetical protein MONOS_10381 [Monocercomonoides exilis]|eukprot:MONOS_10381.1-p1 / transcript=MONOS_10381.1 / gene=MONOS_10381 / organism=Monocercomonoides_exilis_PA203 / gene_product=unspecified product / transcript_product=unspecified product / location=Mono_scaffold00469:42193-42971(-) / protein_length=221 / sequence_SO=supercontig / SO=protein_coding / is_pseudo=false
MIVTQPNRKRKRRKKIETMMINFFNQNPTNRNICAHFRIIFDFFVCVLSGIVIGTDDTAQLKVPPQEDIQTEVKLQACRIVPRSECACLFVNQEFQPLSMPLNAPAGTMIPSLATCALMGRVCGEALHPAAPGQFHCATIFRAHGVAEHLEAAAHTLSPLLVVVKAKQIPNAVLPCVLLALAAYFLAEVCGDSLNEMLMKFRRIPSIALQQLKRAYFGEDG